MRVFIITWQREGKLRGETGQLPVRLAVVSVLVSPSRLTSQTDNLSYSYSYWTESEEDQETSPASVWQRRRGEQRTPPSSGRSVYNTVAAILLYSILPDIMLSWATVLLELTSFTARLSSPLTVGGITAEDINVFTLASQNTE